MTKKRLSLITLFITGTYLCSPALATDWEKVGATTEECSFQATLYRLKGFPFAKLEVTDKTGSEVIPLVLQEETQCKKVRYETAYPRSLELPTYRVEMKDLCQGSLPKVSVSIFYSGVTKDCRMEY